jgi:RNA polymerase sigma-70 factor (ECF subfamily)
MVNDHDPWPAWLERHAAALILLARQYVRDQAEAEDVVQEALVRFWKVRDRVSDASAFIYASIKGVALDERRTQARRKRREETSARAMPSSWFVPTLDDDERRASVEAALRMLPEPQREVLVMRIWGGLSFPQVAEALRIPENTAKSRYRYALSKLGGWLAEEAVL